jgi:hypothetical protein
MQLHIFSCLIEKLPRKRRGAESSEGEPVVQIKDYIEHFGAELGLVFVNNADI